MNSTIEPGRTYFVEANKPDLIDKDLNEAVDLALEYAMKAGQYGILVTRHGHSTFTVAVSAEVPFRQTREENSPLA
ncbi:hypothetical protein [Arthrobacter sp. MMS18-M83]|uniref:hypothetical protein n=1 Tax=Arthrobacter sp. MMS18-M83 TaxID=2996261 RepID=UPI00227A9A6E|nr:hypothetical protein [Arthrobacter sp. MMS18-M83]WAH98228.1 hypothetical protein OW521_04955 [Arthrobacter sp. MMS18-M83]